MFNLGVPELILILVVGLVVFGPKKLPEVGRSVGKGLREFKKAMNDIKQTIDIESEFKEVADIKKEVTDIKAGLKEAVLGSETPNNTSAAPFTQSEPAEAEEADADAVDPRRAWVNNSAEWSMPEWVAPTEDKAPESDNSGGSLTSEGEGSEMPGQETVTAEKDQLPAKDDKTTLS